MLLRFDRFLQRRPGLQNQPLPNSFKLGLRPNVARVTYWTHNVAARYCQKHDIDSIPRSQFCAQTAIFADVLCVSTGSPVCSRNPRWANYSKRRVPLPLRKHRSAP